MKKTAQVLSGISLAMIIVPPCLYFAGNLEIDAAKTWMFVATVAWFVSAPLWMEHKNLSQN